MSLKTISPSDAKRRIDAGAQLIDIRGAREYAREHIPGARNYPLESLGPLSGDFKETIFHCKAGVLTANNAATLAEASPACEAFLLDGGLNAWKRAGLPVVTDHSQPIEIERQVQIAAGSLVLLGVALGALVSPAFYALSALVGAGLVFSGVAGWCGMAKAFAFLPWNRPARSPA